MEVIREKYTCLSFLLWQLQGALQSLGLSISWHSGGSARFDLGVVMGMGVHMNNYVSVIPYPLTKILMGGPSRLFGYIVKIAWVIRPVHQANFIFFKNGIFFHHKICFMIH
jgi:hypothetical protein